MKVINTPRMRTRENSTSYNTIRKQGSSKEAYTNGSKSTRRKKGYTALFTDTTRRGALPEEASIHTAEMTEQ